MPTTATRPRQPLEVTVCFVPLLAWIVRSWRGTTLAITIDATPLRDRFVVLAVCVVYRGSGIPVAWAILPAGQQRPWRREWLRLLRLLRPAVPRDWTVIVLADRGLYAPWLFRRIVRSGWHPFLRVNQGANSAPSARPSGSGSKNWSPPKGHNGGDAARPSKSTPCTAPWWRGGGLATLIPG